MVNQADGLRVVGQKGACKASAWPAGRNPGMEMFKFIEGRTRRVILKPIPLTNTNTSLLLLQLVVL